MLIFHNYQSLKTQKALGRDFSRLKHLLWMPDGLDPSLNAIAHIHHLSTLKMRLDVETGELPRRWMAQLAWRVTASNIEEKHT